MLAHIWRDVVEGQLFRGRGEDLLVPTIEIYTVQKLHRQPVILGWVSDKWECFLVKERRSIRQLSDFNLLQEVTHHVLIDLTTDILRVLSQKFNSRGMSGTTILIDALLQSILGHCILVYNFDDRLFQPKLFKGRYDRIQCWISRTGVLLFYIH